MNCSTPRGPRPRSAVLVVGRGGVGGVVDAGRTRDPPRADLGQDGHEVVADINVAVVALVL